MRLYLSSFRVGDHPEHLLSMLRGGTSVGVVTNAMDPYSRRGMEDELPRLTELGLDAVEVDLRNYFSVQESVFEDLARFDLIWARGGNAFALRQAMAKSGADHALVELLRADSIVYGGYSAGPCVLAPSLRGLELCDDIPGVEQLYDGEVLFDGLGILDFAFVPHFDSPGHPETELMNLVVAYYEREGVPYRTFRDGQALVIDGDNEFVA